jgi:ketosteroid isomerase-like protein
MRVLAKTLTGIALSATVAFGSGCSKQEEAGHADARPAAAPATESLAAASAATAAVPAATAAAPVVASLTADENAIRQVVVQTVDAAARGDMDTYLKFYGPNAALVLPGLPITYGIESPRKNGFPAGYAIKMDTAKVEIASAGDLGYAFGTYEQRAPDAKTKKLADTTGKWMAVFKKQPDGRWGAIADTYNVDPPK